MPKRPSTAMCAVAPKRTAPTNCAAATERTRGRVSPLLSAVKRVVVRGVAPARTNVRDGLVLPPKTRSAVSPRTPSLTTCPMKRMMMLARKTRAKKRTPNSILPPSFFLFFSICSSQFVLLHLCLSSLCSICAFPFVPFMLTPASVSLGLGH